MDNRGQRLGQHSRVPGKDISKDKKTKIKKKLMQKGGNECSGPWKKSRSQCKGMLKLWHMPKSPDPSSTFPCVQMLSWFLIVRLCHSYVTCQVQYVSFSFCIFFFPLLMLFSRLSLTGLPPAPSTVLLQPPPASARWSAAGAAARANMCREMT